MYLEIIKKKGRCLSNREHLLFLCRARRTVPVTAPWLAVSLAIFIQKNKIISARRKRGVLLRLFSLRVWTNSEWDKY